MMSSRVHLVLGFMLSFVAPAGADTLSFQQGDGGAYSETAATFVVSDIATNHGGEPTLLVHTFDGYITSVSLVRFADMIGSNAGQVPAGSTVSSAMLQMTGWVPVGNPMTSVHQAYHTWDEYSVHGGNWSVYDDTNYGPSVGWLPGAEAGEAVSCDVTSIVQNWANGVENWGFYIQRPLSEGLYDTRYHSDDASTPAYRPKLTVNFTPPSVAVESTTWGRVKALYR